MQSAGIKKANLHGRVSLAVLLTQGTGKLTYCSYFNYPGPQNSSNFSFKIT